MTRLRLPAIAAAAVVGLLVAACNGAATDTIYPACNGLSNEGLTSESLGGACPAHPTRLIGTATTGQPCTQASDCAPTCCQCPGGAAALVAQCTGSGCLDGNETCCLYAHECS